MGASEAGFRALDIVLLNGIYVIGSDADHLPACANYIMSSTEQTGLTCIMSAPSGAKLQKADHPAIPISIEETIQVAADCQKLGAQALHAHVRDTNYAHSLDVGLYRELLGGLASELGSNFPIQVTTEAVGIYTPEQQMHMVKELRPKYISAALRELAPDQSSTQDAAKFYSWCVDEQVAVQHILYDDNDVKRFIELKAQGIVPEQHNSILIVLGRYVKDQLSDPKLVFQYHEQLKDQELHWMLCAFGYTETDCLMSGASLGAGCRVGFENNRLNSDGTVAKSNAERVRILNSAIESAGISLASDAQVRQWLGGIA